MNLPLVSIIIPTYNRGRALMLAVSCVFEQTYKNLEIIVVDDNSSEDIEALLRSEFPNDVSRLIYIKNSENYGNAKSRNEGLKRARGDLVAFLDDDDLWLQSKIEKQVQMLTATGTDGCFCGTIWIENEMELRKTIAINPLISFENGGPTSTWMLKREVFDRIGSFDESFPANVDGEFLVRFNKNCTSSFVKEYLYKHFYYPDQITASIKKKIVGFEGMIRKHRDIFNSAEMSSAYLKLAIFFFFGGSKKFTYLFESLSHSVTMPAVVLLLLFLLPTSMGKYLLNLGLDLKKYPKSYISRYGTIKA